MDYLLIVLTHGGGATLRRALESFEAHVTPQPLDAVLVEDGSQHLLPVDWWTGRRVHTGGRRGFCEAVAAGWSEASATELPYVYWLEHDFLHLDDVDLRPIAAVLDRNRHLAQMSLMRQPVNAAERDRGGVLGGVDTMLCDDFATGSRWIEHGAYWTTNPSLFRSVLTAEHQWPDGPECEGKFGLQLRAAGFAFGVWGNGTPMVDHIGIRDGSGIGY